MVRRSPHLVLVRPPLRVPRASYTTLACPPIGLAYVAAAAERGGVRVTVVDALGEAPRRVRVMANRRFLRLGLSNAEIVSRIPSDADVIGVTSNFSEEWPLVRGVIKAIGQSFPKLPIVGGGEHLSACPEFSLRDCEGALDVVVIGEGEATLVALMDAIAARADLEEVSGIAFLRRGEFVKTPARARLRHIDAIARPAWHLLPLERYLDEGLAFGIGRVRSMPIMATRGCPYRCTFCSNPQMWGTRWMARDPADVVDEMAFGVRRYGAQNFDFYDLTAVVRKDWILEFCERVQRADLRVTIQLPSGTRSEALDEEVLKALKASGCHHLVYAPESGSTSLLRRIKKKVDLDRMKRSMKSAVDLGITVKCNMIMGFPHETPEDALETLRFAAELARLGVHDLNIGPFCPYPGSEDFDALMASGKLDPIDDAYFDMLANYSDLSSSVAFNNHVSPRALAAFRIAAMGTFYGIGFARRPARLWQVAKAAATGAHQTRLDRVVADLGRRTVDTLLGPMRGGANP